MLLMQRPHLEVSKCDPLTSGISIPGELLKNAESHTPSQFYIEVSEAQI